MRTIGLPRLAALLLAAAAVAACDATAPSPSVSETAPPAKPSVTIETWGVSAGTWSFNGHVDPQGDPTDVILEIGPGPQTARIFNEQVPVASDLVDAGPLTATTAKIPDIPEICVRFAATNSAGTSLSTPLCFPHDLPSFFADALPPTTTFTTPPTLKTEVVKTSSYTVAWTELDADSGVRSRSLQRQVATYAGGACGPFTDEGDASISPSPVEVTGLQGGKCYQWVMSLRDGVGNQSDTISGVVRVE